MTDKFLLNISRFLENEPFFSMISLNIGKKADNSFPHAIALEFDKHNNEFVVTYNPIILEKNTPIEHWIIYKHELYHFILEHLTLRQNDKIDHAKWNICADWSINGLPDMIEVMSRLVLHFKNNKTSHVFVPGYRESKDIPPLKTLEWYINNINDDFFDKFQESDLFDIINPIKDNVAKTLYDAEKLRIIKKAVEESNKKANWGSCPLDIKEQLITSIKDRLLSPEDVLKMFIVRSITFARKNYLMRQNRRNSNKIGKVKEKCAKFAVCVDESGSISNALLSKFMSFMEQMSDLCSFIMIPFDSTINVNGIYEWKKGQKLEHKRKRSGGTNFDAPTEYINNNKFDGCLFLTDGDGQHTIPSKCRRVFIIPKSSSYYEKSLNSKFNDLVVVLEKDGGK